MGFAEENPELVAALDELEKQWTEAEIKQYNFMDEEGQDTRAVVEIMLRDNGLVDHVVIPSPQEESWFNSGQVVPISWLILFH